MLDDDEGEKTEDQVDEGPSKMDFVKEQLQTNERFREMLTKHFTNFESKLAKSKKIDKKYKKGIMDSLNQGLVRQAKKQMDDVNNVKRRNENDATMSPTSQFAYTMSPSMAGTQLNIRLQTASEMHNEDFAATMSYIDRNEQPRAPPKVPKEVLARDTFSGFNVKAQQ